jgi:predicted dinucleotide-binding enzyme
MNIAVFGTGVVGRTIAAKLASLGHDVMIGTRDVNATLERATPDAQGAPPFRDWHHHYPQVQLSTFKTAAAQSVLIINATGGASSIDALTLASAETLNGKIIIDVANPLDFSQGMPPSLFVSNTDSLAERIQRAFPETRIVKTLNTMRANLMVDPQQLAGGDHTVFVSGNDTDAKAQVTTWLKDWFGWSDVIDLGDITTARGTEMLLPIWLRLWGALQTPQFNFKIVR